MIDHADAEFFREEGRKEIRNKVQDLLSKTKRFCREVAPLLDYAQSKEHLEHHANFVNQSMAAVREIIEEIEHGS